jgi:hypothetical protein
MDKKQILILSVILGILALGILVKSWVRSTQETVLPAQGEGVILADFDPSRIERILIGRSLTQAEGGSSGSPMELVKEKGAWKVKSLWNADADSAKVEKFLGQFHAVRGELRGTGKKLFPDFGIQEKEAFSIELFDSKEALVAEFLIGTKQAGENGFFIRGPSSEEVYLADLGLTEILGMNEDVLPEAPPSGVWADLRLFKVDPEKVTRITVFQMKEDQKSMVAGLERTVDLQDQAKNSWKFLRKEMTLPLDPAKVSRFIAVMNSLRAEKVMDPLGKGYGLEKPVWQLAVTEGSKKTILNAGSEDEKEGRRFVSRPGDPTIFALQSPFFDDLNIDDTHFVKDIALDAEAQKAA